MNPKERSGPSIEGNIQVAKPIDIFPEQQEIQPAFLKTPKMIEVERLIQEKLQVFLHKKYSEENLSTPEISQMLKDISNGNVQTPHPTIAHWLRKFAIPVRSTEEAIRLSWQDPEKRKRRIEGIDSPTANRKRSEAMHNKWESYSELEKRGRRRGAREGTRKALLRRRQETLGEDPTERLKEMLDETERYVIYRRNLTEGRRASSTEIAEELGVTRQRVGQIEKRALRKLAAMQKTA